MSSDRNSTTRRAALNSLAKSLALATLISVGLLFSPNLGAQESNENNQQPPKQELKSWPESKQQWWRLRISSGEGKSIVREGNIWIKAQDESVLFEDRLGVLHLLAKDDILGQEEIKKSNALKGDDLERRLKSLLPPGFKIRKTNHYTICYWTDKRYAVWVGNLYERLYKNFKAFWNKKGFKFQESDRPKVILVFKNKAQYKVFTDAQLGAGSGDMIGYYHLLNHWVVMYDLTSDNRFGNRKKSVSEILSHPNAVPLVATIIHEGTHQLMFHSNMQVRLSGISLWVSEGLAVFFEAPDLKSKRAWTRVGKVNVLRIGPFRQYMRRRPTDSLKTLIQDDKRFQDASTSTDAYAESWALNFFLLKKYPKQYSSYLRELSNRYPQQIDTPEQRVQLFTKHIGMSLQQLDEKLIKFYSKKVRGE